MAAIKMLPDSPPGLQSGGRSPEQGERNADVYRFGEYSLSLAQRRLCRAGEPVRLNPRALDLLAVLVRAPGRVVSRERLLREVWGGIAVQESNLTVNMCLLRRALGGGGAGELIATVPGRGYQFLAPVEAPAARLAVERFEPLGEAREFTALGAALPPTLVAWLSRLPGVAVCEARPEYRLRGWFQEHAGSVRVSARLERGEGAEVAWAEQRTFGGADPFDLHDRIAAWLQAAMAEALAA